MAVTHFINKDTITLCKTKGKSPITTEVKELVTCKRCLKKLNMSVIGSKTTPTPKRSTTKTTAEIVGKHVILTSKDYMFRFDLKPSKHFMLCTTTGTIFTSSALCGTQVKKNLKETERIKMVALFIKLKDDEGNISGRQILEHFKEV